MLTYYERVAQFNQSLRQQEINEMFSKTSKQDSSKTEKNEEQKPRVLSKSITVCPLVSTDINPLT
jgi:hypothetical protein